MNGDMYRPLCFKIRDIKYLESSCHNIRYHIAGKGISKTNATGDSRPVRVPIPMMDIYFENNPQRESFLSKGFLNRGTIVAALFGYDEWLLRESL